jgi:hypothetical protein
MRLAVKAMLVSRYYLKSVYGSTNTCLSDEFAVTPGLHSQDLVYTFNPITSPALAPIAQSFLQESIVSFTFNGVPQNNGAGAFPLWNSGHRDIRITANNSNVILSTINATRCSWWQDTVFS